MYELDAAKYHESLLILANVISLVDGRPKMPQQAVMPQDSLVNTLEMLDRLLQTLEPLHVPITKITIVDTKGYLTTQPMLFAQCGQLLLAVAHNLRRELQSVKVFALDTARVNFYGTSTPLFGAEVDSKFPSASYEIEQAGKCYACDLSSASAFHSIRCLEAGIRALARCLRIADPTRGRDRNWSNVSKSIRDEIESQWPASSGRMSGDAQTFDEIYGSLAGIQNPYRNATMHLDAKYTAPEALHIFEMVKGLMQKIASRMNENGDPKV